MSTLAETVQAALRVWDQQKAAGATQETRDAALECVLRAAWPQRREWKYLCDWCEDTGWELRTCGPGTGSCGRPFRITTWKNQTGQPDGTGQGQCTPGHTYVRACACAKGQAMQRMVEGRVDGDEEVTGAGRRRGRFTRFGR